MTPLQRYHLRGIDQPDTLSFEFRQLTLQHLQCLRIRVSDTHRETLLSGLFQQQRQLLPDRLWIAVIVQEHIPAGVGNTPLPRQTLSHGPWYGAAVHKKYRLSRPETLHQPVHRPGVSGQEAAHVVVDALHVRYCLKALIQRLQEIRFGHMKG